MGLTGSAPDRDVVLVLPGLGPGGSQRVATMLLNAWRRDGKRAMAVTLLNEEPDVHRLEAGVERVRLPDFLRARRSPSAARAGLAIHRSLPRLAARTFDLVGFDLRTFAARTVGARLEPERYLAVFYPELLREIRGLRQLLREARPRVIIGFLGSAGVPAILAARPLGLPVVVSERNDPAIEKLDAPWQHLRERTYRWATLVTANSRGALDTMQAFVPSSKLAYVPNPIVLRDAAPGSSPRDRTILAAGRLVPRKGFDMLLRAFADCAPSMAGWRVEILGDGPLRQELTRLAETLGVRERVVFHGHVDDPFPHYGRAAMFVLSSRYEGMPNVLLEAMASGLPAVVSDASPGPLEEVTDGENGLVVPAGDVAALAGAMSRLAGDAGLRRTMGEVGRTRAAEHGLEKTLAVWDAVMARACRDHAGDPAGNSSGDPAESGSG